MVTGVANAHRSLAGTNTSFDGHYEHTTSFDGHYELTTSFDRPARGITGRELHIHRNRTVIAGPG